MYDPDEETLTLELDRQEALVYMEWLFRHEESTDNPYENPDEATAFEMAVQRLHWDLIAMLESTHPDISSHDYEERLDAAVEAVRDPVVDE